MKIKGGHAVMLEVSLDHSIINTVVRWASMRPGRTMELDKPHVTLAFVGRDLPEEAGQAMLEVARNCLEYVPTTVEFNGRFAMFGPTHNRLVAVLRITEALDFIHSTVSLQLANRGFAPVNNYSFVPHITLATGIREDYAPRMNPGLIQLMVTGMLVKIGKEYQKV